MSPSSTSRSAASSTRLDELGLSDDTSVFFTADHGEFTGAHRLHDKGPAMYEDIYRIPGIIRIPGCRPAGQGRVGQPHRLHRHAARTGGLRPVAGRGQPQPGPARRGEHPDWPGELVAEFHGHHFPYPQRMIRDDRYKLVVNPESVNELYDLESGPARAQQPLHAPRIRAGPRAG